MYALKKRLPGLTVNKDSFESFEAGPFVCSEANEAEVCAVVFIETSCV